MLQTGRCDARRQIPSLHWPTAWIKTNTSADVVEHGGGLHIKDQPGSAPREGCGTQGRPSTENGPSAELAGGRLPTWSTSSHAFPCCSNTCYPCARQTPLPSRPCARLRRPPDYRFSAVFADSAAVSTCSGKRVHFCGGLFVTGVDSKFSCTAEAKTERSISISINGL